jgi:hypothetical protein
VGLYSGLLGDLTQLLDIQGDYDCTFEEARALLAEWRSQSSSEAKPESNVIYGVDFRNKEGRYGLGC